MQRIDASHPLTSLGKVIKEVFLIINQREADDVEMVQHFRLRGWDCFESKGKNTPAPTPDLT
jgi:hypothetical protein